VTIVPVRAATADLTKVALTDLEVASTAPVAAALVIWTARPRIGPAVDKEANASRTSNAAALIDLVAVKVDPVATGLVAAVALAEEDSADLVEAVVDSGAADDK